MQSKQLQLVRDKEINEKHALSQKLACAAALAHGEQQQLEQLKDYQEDYLKMIQAEQVGWSASKSTHYREFCYQLSQVIDGQINKLEQTKITVNELKKAVQQQQHKIDVIDEMLDRQSLALLAAENKHYQQESDALTARRFY